MKIYAKFDRHINTCLMVPVEFTRKLNVPIDCWIIFFCVQLKSHYDEISVLFIFFNPVLSTIKSEPIAVKMNKNYVWRGRKSSIFKYILPIQTLNKIPQKKLLFIINIIGWKWLQCVSSRHKSSSLTNPYCIMYVFLLFFTKNISLIKHLR